MTLPLVLLGGAYLLLRGSSGRSTPTTNPSDSPPQAVDDQFTDMPENTWEAVYTVGSRTVWKQGTLNGLLYDTGLDERFYTYHYFIGNSDHSSFVHESQTTYGHLEINGAWAKAYADESAAIAEVDRLSEPDDDDGTGPVSEPEDDGDTGDGGFGGLPLQPSYGFGGFDAPSFGVI